MCEWGGWIPLGVHVSAYMHIPGRDLGMSPQVNTRVPVYPGVRVRGCVTVLVCMFVCVYMCGMSVCIPRHMCESWCVSGCLGVWVRSDVCSRVDMCPFMFP